MDTKFLLSVIADGLEAAANSIRHNLASHKSDHHTVLPEVDAPSVSKTTETPPPNPKSSKVVSKKASDPTPSESARKTEKTANVPTHPLVLDGSRSNDWSSEELYWLRHAVAVKNFSAPRAIANYIKSKTTSSLGQNDVYFKMDELSKSQTLNVVPESPQSSTTERRRKRRKHRDSDGAEKKKKKRRSSDGSTKRSRSEESTA
ncbi:hypothetical protein P9112_012107 [Eukaryota sp. TZLM1-RC]